MNASTPPEAGAGRRQLAGAPEGLSTLISDAIKDLQNMLRGEVQLAKVELKEDAGTIGKATGFLGGAALFGLAGFMFFILALIYLLSKVMPNWLAAGIVSVGLTVTGALLGLAGKDRLSAANLKPQQTIEALKEDKAWAQEQVQEIKDETDRVKQQFGSI